MSGISLRAAVDVLYFVSEASGAAVTATAALRASRFSMCRDARKYFLGSVAFMASVVLS